jgi:hypothetical protein
MPFAHSATEHVDLSGDFKSGQIAGARRRWVRTTALQHVRSVDPRRRYADTYFACARRRIRPLDRPEHFRRPWFRNLNSAHCGSQADLKVRLYVCMYPCKEV